jgi:hypothetical protein
LTSSIPAVEPIQPLTLSPPHVLLLFMDNTPSSARPAPTDPALRRMQREQRILREMAEIGMELAEIVGRQAADPATARANPAEVARIFAHISSLVRQTVMLDARLAREHQALVEKLAAKPPERSLRRIAPEDVLARLTERPRGRVH